MAKFQDIRALAKQQLQAVTKNGECWKAFLHTASIAYNYNFPNQLLIYCQNPTATAVADMEYWNKTKEVTIPTDRVYFYIEKKPLNYANGYAGEIPEVSEEEAAKALPNNSGINAYNGPDRSVTMSRMYYWAQAFQKLYPNEMKVYYENERFVCYYIEQNTYRLYNFAIDYGYN